MFITTFYSFKGGVGRSMALANIAAHLAENGKNVLVVDFDLEAPGLSLMFPTKADIPGVLEFVHEYKESGVSPDVREYCYKVSLRNPASSLWVMPASRPMGDNTAALASIDWNDLYTHGNGYLMIEDLKQQWKEYLGVDYVLVDSRTGHTDVEGICTRQLPDALVVLFYPNVQNLAGVSDVTRRVRDHVLTSKRTIEPLFVASNVPDLDDEHEVLANMLNRFQNSLGYPSLDGTIHHYPSLMLLEDPIWITSRPKTRLAREYREVADRIRMKNPADEVGALALLDHELSGQSIEPRGAKFLEELFQHHADNPQVLHKLSYWTEQRGDVEETLTLLNRAVELGYHADDVYIRRAQLNGERGRADLASEDLLQALQSAKLSLADVVKCIQLNQRFGLDVLRALPSSPGVLSLGAMELLHVLEEMSFSRSGLRIALDILNAHPRNSEKPYRRMLENQRALMLIGLGRFEEAIQIISAGRRPAAGDDDQIVFNYAMAEWGLTGVAPSDLLALVVEDASPPGAAGTNYDQCLAIACAVVEQNEKALMYMDTALQRRGETFFRAFSCWSYLQRSGSELQQELLQTRAFISDRTLRPLFLQPQDLFDQGGTAQRELSTLQ